MVPVVMAAGRAAGTTMVTTSSVLMMSAFHVALTGMQEGKRGVISTQMDERGRATCIPARSLTLARYRITKL